MNSRKLNSATEQQLQEAYAAAAISHDQGTRAGDSGKANRAATRIAAIYRELRRRGPDSQAILVPLLQHEHPAVRAWAAAHALEFAPDRGESVLQEIAAGDDPFLGLDAELTLSEWRKGTLRFP